MKCRIDFLVRGCFSFIVLGWIVAVSPAHAAPCNGSDLQGVVFHDYNADGLRSAGNVEPGIGGVVVTAFSNDGSSETCETLAGALALLLALAGAWVLVLRR